MIIRVGRPAAWLRGAMCAAAILFAVSVGLDAQRRVAGFIDPMPTAKLQSLFPTAGAFVPRGEKDPLYFTAVDKSRPPKPLGYAFWTIDLVPGELGYHGHIHMLIGMDTAGRLTGVIMDVNTEPYGDISIDLPEFSAQFKGKSIRDKFLVGEDIDAVSRATISVRAAAREIRESARMVARSVLRPDALR